MKKETYNEKVDLEWSLVEKKNDEIPAEKLEMIEKENEEWGIDQSIKRIS